MDNLSPSAQSKCESSALPSIKLNDHTIWSESPITINKDKNSSALDKRNQGGELMEKDLKRKIPSRNQKHG
jgi:hypothetical protein